MRVLDERRADAWAAAERLCDFLAHHKGVTVLTGAGCSTESGIPDYRDEQGQWKHRQPMVFASFMSRAVNRQRYWAQSFSGWERMSAAQPNPAHLAIAELEQREYVSCVVTQNVDSLHQRAGSREVIDLHGVLRQVRCVTCRVVVARHRFQQQLANANPAWHAFATRLAPDGDAKLSREDFASFVVPDCAVCGGILKPDVVFFGESVAKPLVSRVHEQVDRSAALLVVGSSLMVFSGYRFVRSAHAAGKPVTIVNRGTTRADDLATHKLSGNCAEILPLAVQLLAG